MRLAVFALSCSVLLVGACVDTGSPDAALADAATSRDADPRDAGASLDAAPASDGAAPHDGAEPDAGQAPDGAAPDAAAPDAAAPDAAAPDAAPRPWHVYVGSGAGNIHHYILDADGTALSARGVTRAGRNPSFLAWSASALYAVDEIGQGAVQAFSIDAASGELTANGRVSAEGNGPAHVSVAPSGRFVLAANYGDGRIAVLPVQPGGGLGAAVHASFAGANAHLIVADAAERHVLVPCLGANYVAQYDLDAAGHLTANAVPTAALPPGAGPRHLALHPTARWAYVLNELDSTITRFEYDAALGRLSAGETQSTLPAGFAGNNSGAEVAVHPSGAWVYSSNRGHDSIARFAVDAAGRLTLRGHTPTGGRTPRHFGLTPDGAFMLVANQQSGDVRVFRVDAASGELTATGATAAVSGPAFVGAR